MFEGLVSKLALSSATVMVPKLRWGGFVGVANEAAAVGELGPLLSLLAAACGCSGDDWGVFWPPPFPLVETGFCTGKGLGF